MRIEKFNVVGAGKVFLDPRSFCPRRRIIIELELDWDAQYDGHSRTAEEELECFYQSARPMLDHISKECDKPN
jgi:hypothetical protein